MKSWGEIFRANLYSSFRPEIEKHYQGYTTFTSTVIRRPRRIFIKEIPHESNKWATLGDWWFGDEQRNINQDGDLYITISQMPMWKYFWPILAHEIIEIAWCLTHGVTSQECEDYDAMWEDELNRGLHKPEEEAGFDKRSPYRGGHIWGARFERLVCWILGINWKKYCRDCEEIFQ